MGEGVRLRHPNIGGGFSLTFNNKGFRDFWVECGQESRRISEQIGRELSVEPGFCRQPLEAPCVEKVDQLKVLLRKTGTWTYIWTRQSRLGLPT